LEFSTPVAAASGGFGYGVELEDLASPDSLGALITPTITLLPRAGNPPPRTAETAAGLLHSIGYANPGLAAFLSQSLPALQALPCPAIVSILGGSAREWQELARSIGRQEGIAGVELNLSAVLLTGEASILSWIRESVRAARSETGLPLIVKLPPANVEIGAAARAAAEAGADVISVSQGFPGVAVRLSARKFRLPGVSGELSGPCIKPLALYQVWRVADSVELPILASGGIMTGEDALEFFVAGASAVAVGIASSIHPTAIARITHEIAEYLTHHRIPAIADLCGIARRESASP
jgi:dihydroorotate dehydrogenase (NAD+) catalytic subunit